MDWFQTPSKALIWLLAALVPLQGFPGAACCCAGQVEQAVDAKPSPEQPANCCCCSRPAAKVPAASDAGSCCRQADADVERTSCSCELDCMCQGADAPPRPEPIPSEDRSRSCDQAAVPLATFCLGPGDSESMEPQRRTSIVLGGSDRCVLLCRFQL